MREAYSIEYMPINMSVYDFDTVNSAAMNIGFIYLFKLVFSFSPDKNSEVETWDHMVVLLLIF